MRSRRLLALVAALSATACSQQASDMAERSQSEPPDIAPRSAPGVAFRFSYDYSLDDQRISAVQEAHASSCENLGPTKCRITGMDYEIDSRERVTGMLQVKLDPAIAREFGKQATAAVAQSEGDLVRSEFQGEDVGTQIGAGQNQQADLQSRIAEMEKRLASLQAGDREATQLQAQIEELRAQLAATRSAVQAGQEQLASTPMTFNYYGEGGIAGFDENPIKASWRLMIESAVTMVSIVLKVVGALLPWAILLLLIVALVRSRVGRGVVNWWRRFAPRAGEEE